AELLGRLVRRHKGLVGSAAVAALLIFVTVGVAFWLITQSANDAIQAANDAKRERQNSQREAALLALDRAIALGEDGDARRGLLWLVHSLELAEDAQDQHLQDFIRMSIAAWRWQLFPLKAIYEGHVNSHEGMRADSFWETAAGRRIVATFPKDASL